MRYRIDDTDPRDVLDTVTGERLGLPSKTSARATIRLLRDGADRDQWNWSAPNRGGATGPLAGSIRP